MHKMAIKIRLCSIPASDYTFNIVDKLKHGLHKYNINISNKKTFYRNMKKIFNIKNGHLQLRQNIFFPVLFILNRFSNVHSVHPNIKFLNVNRSSTTHIHSQIKVKILVKK